jgi:hypothetical protein
MSATASASVDGRQKYYAAQLFLEKYLAGMLQVSAFSPPLTLRPHVSLRRAAATSAVSMKMSGEESALSRRSILQAAFLAPFVLGQAHQASAKGKMVVPFILR